MLKREIFDRGFQVQYETTTDFLEPVERALSQMADADMAALVEEWKKRHPDRADVDVALVKTKYLLLILEEIARRAGVAANRTNEW
ncbi:hypothetical protein D9M70_586810 [compost metagenome]